jgi:hypothetical protein
MTEETSLWLKPGVFGSTHNSKIICEAIDRLPDSSQKELARKMEEVLVEKEDQEAN